MRQPPATPEERYAGLVATMLGEPGVAQEGRGFGANGLKIRHHNFAMLVRGRLVVKLPAARVDALVAAGFGERFDPRKNGRRMKEWLVLAPEKEAHWEPLAREALAFVGQAE